MSSLSDRERSIRQRLKDDFPHYARKCLKIRPKTGDLKSFELNGVQLLAHERAEAQLKRTGKVRLLIVKGRQMGISTYAEGRFFQKVTHRRGVRAFILTHRDDATTNLFGIAKRFYESCPELIRPETRASNARELDFGVLDSGYRVGTAKAEGVGRSDTIQYLHGSEVAWWTGSQEHAAGVLQSVPDEPGTEIWLESTANGIGGLFYNLCMQAMRGENEYELLFFAWFTHGEYRTTPPEGWAPEGEMAEYMALHGLGLDQMYWAQLKNAALAAADGLPADKICWRFRQEYPATVQEAFQSSGAESYIHPSLVTQARHYEAPAQDHAALLLGCDFARGERDHNWFMSRRGRQMGAEVNDRFHSDDTVHISNRLARHIDEHDVDMAFLDTGGGGAQVFDILKDRGYRQKLTLVNFGAPADDDRKYANKRAEMAGLFRDWLSDPGGADIPDDDVLQSEICCVGADENSNNQLILQSKKSIRKEFGFSPDGFDAAGLTFAETVRVQLVKPKRGPHRHQGGSGWLAA